MTERKRPVSITIIAWLLIVGGGYGVVATPITYQKMQDPAFRNSNPAFKNLPPFTAVDVAFGIASSLVSLAAGVFMLRGAAWSRLAYLVLCVFNFGYQIISGRFSIIMIPGLLLTALVLYFLFNRRATEYFTDVSSD